MRVPNGHRARRFLLVPALACAALLCSAPAALAVGLTVDSLGDGEEGNCSPTTSCTLREAINLVIEGEDEPGEGIGGDVTIEFDDDVEGAIEIEEEFELIFGEGVESLTIAGPGRSVVSIDGKGTTRIFRTYEGEVTISGLTLENGHVGGFAVDGDGGAGLFVNGGDITVEDVRFTANTIESERSGAAIDVEEGNLTVLDSQIDHNSTDANVEGSGGGINVDSSGSTVTIKNTEITDNTTDVGQGGGIYQDEGNLVVEGSLIAGNKVGTGNAGGGIAAEQDGSHTTTIVGSTIEGNDASHFGYGGGVWSKPGSGGVTIENSTVAGNSAMVAGGVMVLGPTTIDTSTIAANDGGGVGVAGETTIHASTIVGNEVEAGAGGGINEAGDYEVKVRSTIVSGNKEAGGPSDCAGEITSEGNNILGFAPGYCTWSEAAGDQLGVDPKLGQLADNGGPTATIAPISASSPAINHGSFPNFEDQRGKARPVPEGVAADTDVGAVEVQAPINEAAPTISSVGEPAEGIELTCAAGSWDTDTVTEFEPAYVWLVAGDQVATTQTYTPSGEDAEKEIVCRETVDNGPASAEAESDPVEFGGGALAVSPGAHDFGSRNVGSGPGASQTFMVKNTGGAAVTVAEAGSGSAQFPVDDSGCEAMVLTPGDECAVEVSFAPSGEGERTGTLTVSSDEVPSATASLKGTGTVGAVAISPSSFDFGSRRANSGPSTAKIFEVSSAGTGPVTIGTPAITGTDGAMFKTPANGDECAGETLQPSEKCTLEVVFEPTETGAATASLEVPSDSPTATTGLSGTGTMAAISIAPGLTEFGSQPINLGPGAAKAFTVESTGTEALEIGEPSVSGQYEIPAGGDECEGESLQPGEECTIEVVFDPSTLGEQMGSLSVPGNAPTAVATLSGIGVSDPAFAADPTELAFGSHEVGTIAAQTVTISNSGGAPAEVDSVAVVGGGAFALAAGGDECSGAELIPNGTCTVEVNFAPSEPGAASANLEVAGDAPTLAVALSGTGSDKPAPPSPAPPSASLLNGSAPVANAEGAVPLTVRCNSTSGSACAINLALQAGGTVLGDWNGTLAPGASLATAVPLNAAARKRLGAKGKLAAEAVLGVAGGNSSTLPLTLLAPKAPTLQLKAAKLVGNSVRFKLGCSGDGARCKGHLALTAGATNLLAGPISIAKGEGQKTLPLTAAGRRLLADGAGPQLLAKLSTKDPVYQRTTVTKKQLRLGG